MPNCYVCGSVVYGGPFFGERVVCSSCKFSSWPNTVFSGSVLEFASEQKSNFVIMETRLNSIEKSFKEIKETIPNKSRIEEELKKSMEEISKGKEESRKMVEFAAEQLEKRIDELRKSNPPLIIAPNMIQQQHQEQSQNVVLNNIIKSQAALVSDDLEKNKEAYRFLGEGVLNELKTIIDQAKQSGDVRETVTKAYNKLAEFGILTKENIEKIQKALPTLFSFIMSVKNILGL